MPIDDGNWAAIADFRRTRFERSVAVLCRRAVAVDEATVQDAAHTSKGANTAAANTDVCVTAGAIAVCIAALVVRGIAD
jgi:hypothetical protein